MGEVLELKTPARPERSCATCRHWIEMRGRNRAWCPVLGRGLVGPLTGLVCTAYERETQESYAVELYEQLVAGDRKGGGAGQRP
jgi:hypothetical protein